MGYVGIDPSYTRTGLALFEDDVLILTYMSKEEATQKDYQTLYHRLQTMTDRIVNRIEESITIKKVISEEPLPNASFSSGLFALDTVLFHKLSQIKTVEKIYNVHPSYLVHIHKKRGYSKSESVQKAKELIQIYEKMGVKVIIDPKRLAHDTAEALIFLTRLLVLDNVRIKEQLLSEVLKDYPEFLTQKEKLLYERVGKYGEK